ncbi:hypothetical protein H9S87_18655 (plasmid) [Bacillus pumilus]|uniref:hypothetical protein n=1 Tax=Bacillus pumilus TaxID=1408 RepID=UPI00165783AB|nr:hypothetical protein [Bacillus pumilus]QNP18306.1 hypothetical protein H9S87_18655 [Bacillus pumilus]
MKKKIIAGIAVATIAVAGFGGAYVYNKQAEAKEIAKVEAKESNHFKAAIAAVRNLNKNLNEKNLLAAKEKTELVSDKTAKKSLLADIEQAEKKINFSKKLNKVSNKKGILKPGVTKKQISSLEKALTTIHDEKFVKKESKFLKNLSEQLNVVEKSNKALKAGKSEKDLDLAKKEISKIKNPKLKKEMQDELAKLEKKHAKSTTKVVKQNIVTSNEKSNQGATGKSEVQTPSSNNKVNNNNNYSSSAGGNNQSSNNQKSYKQKSNNSSGYKGNNSNPNNSGVTTKPKSSTKPSSKSNPKPKNNGGTSTTGERTGGGKIKNSDSTYETGVADGNDLSGVPWDSFSK